MGTPVPEHRFGPACVTSARIERPCSVCESVDHTPFLEERLDKLGDMSFSSRKEPDFMSFRMVRCRKCDLVYAPSIPPERALIEAYEAAGFDSGEEARWAAATYARELRGLFAEIKDKGGALEVGAGAGAFLAELLKVGFDPVVGIEASAAAVAAADPDVKPYLRLCAFDPSSFTQTFSLVCCFQTLEHLVRPRDFVRDTHRLLKPGGSLALVAHDWSAPLNRILGRHSPIIDTEHMQLFCPKALEALLTRQGFVNIRIRTIRNRYPLRYWIKLLPLPSRVRHAAIIALERLRLARLGIGFNVGNILAVARKCER